MTSCCGYSVTQQSKRNTLSPVISVAIYCTYISRRVEYHKLWVFIDCCISSTYYPSSYPIDRCVNHIYLVYDGTGRSWILYSWFRASWLYINLLAPELFFLILAHTVYKMWIIQAPNKLELWNKLHFKEKKTESIHHV